MGHGTVSCLKVSCLVSFQQRRLHLDAFDATQLAREGTNLIGGAFENDGNDAVITTGKALAADDDACVTG